MKNLIKLLPIIALFIGTTVAFATTKTANAPTHYNTGGSSEIWTSLSGSGIVLGSQDGEYFCKEVANPDACVAYIESGQTMPNPADVEYGDLTQN